MGEPFIKKEKFHKTLFYPCRCDCGKVKNVRGNQLLNCKTKKCASCSGRESSYNNLKGTLAKNGKKICRQCQTEKDVSEFNRNKNTKDGLDSCCKKCHRLRWIKNVYHISFEEIDVKLKNQGNVCGLCKEPFEGSWHDNLAPAVDHDHSTSANRDIIHNRCNRLLGHAKDSAKLLQMAIEYLKRHEKKQRNNGEQPDIIGEA